jgi:hypothetical protein
MPVRHANALCPKATLSRHPGAYRLQRRKHTIPIRPHINSAIAPKIGLISGACQDDCRLAVNGEIIGMDFLRTDGNILPFIDLQLAAATTQLLPASGDNGSMARRAPRAVKMPSAAYTTNVLGEVSLRTNNTYAALMTTHSFFSRERYVH